MTKIEHLIGGKLVEVLEVTNGLQITARGPGVHDFRVQLDDAENGANTISLSRTDLDTATLPFDGDEVALLNSRQTLKMPAGITRFDLDVPEHGWLMMRVYANSATLRAPDGEVVNLVTGEIFARNNATGGRWTLDVQLDEGGEIGHYVKVAAPTEPGTYNIAAGEQKTYLLRGLQVGATVTLNSSALAVPQFSVIYADTVDNIPPNEIGNSYTLPYSGDYVVGVFTEDQPTTLTISVTPPA